MPLATDLEIFEQLGAGHFGTVFRGRDCVHGEVAIKQISRQVGDSEESWARRKASFLAEAQNLSRAAHPNIVRVFRIEEAADENSVRICMEYCANGPVASHGQPLPLPLIRTYATDILHGLANLHAANMLHRDIKPSNVLLHNGRAKIADFGLVTNDLILGYASQAGYLDHLAIEVHNGGLTTAQSDIWAVGMTVYRLLNGEAWCGRNLRPAEQIHLGNYALKLPWMPHVPDAWRRFVRKAMHDSKGSRFSTAWDALNHLNTLPIAPDWNPKPINNGMTWELVSGGRRKIVTFTEGAAGSCSWSAESVPVGSGRARALDSSKKPQTYKNAIEDLRKFFDGYARRFRGSR